MGHHQDAGLPLSDQNPEPSPDRPGRQVDSSYTCVCYRWNRNRQLRPHVRGGGGGETCAEPLSTIR